jgi:hypothetical protein
MTITAQSFPNAAGQEKAMRSKIFTIQVLRGFDMKRPQGAGGHQQREMQPFFHFQFYTFEYTSPVAAGANNPQFDIKRQFEVELNDQLIDYVKSQVLKIDLIDESVELANGASDYIGSVRIPLKGLSITSTMVEEIVDAFPVRDASGAETGRLEVKVSCRDYQGLSSDMIGGGGETFVMSKFQEREVIGRIAEKFAFSEMQSIDMIFDMLIEPGGMDLTRVSKKRFRDYILEITDRVRQ